MTTRSAPLAPWRFLPDPCVPDSARRCGWSRNASSDATLRSAWSQTSPPVPPSPPSGPPFGTWASRAERHRARAAVAAADVDLHLVDERGHAVSLRTAWPRAGRVPPPSSRLGCGRDDVDELAAPAVAELHGAVGGGEQRVVAALADVLAGVEPGAPLAHDDRARGAPRCRCRPSRRAAGRSSRDRCGRRPRPSSSTWLSSSAS